MRVGRNIGNKEDGRISCVFDMPFEALLKGRTKEVLWLM
jgi:hypothetical protein